METGLQPLKTAFESSREALSTLGEDEVRVDVSLDCLDSWLIDRNRNEIMEGVLRSAQRHPASLGGGVRKVSENRSPGDAMQNIVREIALALFAVVSEQVEVLRNIPRSMRCRHWHIVEVPNPGLKHGCLLKTKRGSSSLFLPQRALAVYLEP